MKSVEGKYERRTAEPITLIILQLRTKRPEGINTGHQIILTELYCMPGYEANGKHLEGAAPALLRKADLADHNAPPAKFITETIARI